MKILEDIHKTVLNTKGFSFREGSLPAKMNPHNTLQQFLETLDSSG